MTQARVYGGVSADERRAERRRRLMAAGLDLIGTNGLSGTTFRAVCERARVGPRFFYESFANVESLAIALFDENVEYTLTRAVTAIAAAPGDLESRIRAGVEVFLANVIDDPRIARLVFAETYATPALRQRRFEAMRAITDLAVRQSHELVELPAGDDAVVHAVSRLITGGVAELVMAWLDGGEDIDRETLVDLCVDHVSSAVVRMPGMVDRYRSPHRNSPLA